MTSFSFMPYEVTKSIPATLVNEKAELLLVKKGNEIWYKCIKPEVDAGKLYYVIPEFY